MFFGFFSGDLNAQSKTKSFSKLSSPEKYWVMTHPFVVKKAFNTTQQARTVTDSLKRNGILADGNGGQLDAFRHAYWMALLVQKISPKKAEKLGKAHEKGNYADWKKGNQEDSMRADSMLCVMDLKNNTSGIKIGLEYATDTSSSKISLEMKVLKSVENGRLLIVKKTTSGICLDVNGRIIIESNYKHKWFIPKSLVQSNFEMPPPSGNQK